MSLRRLYLLAALAFAAASPVNAAPGDWQSYKSGPERTSFNPDEATLGTGNVSQLVEKWTITPAGSPFQSPTVVGTIMYVATDDDVAAYRTSNGRRIWRRKLAIPGAAAPAVSDGVVYVSLEGGRVMALDAGNGKVRWSAKTGNLREPTSRSSPLVVEGLVYVGAGDGRLYALKAKTGKVAFAAKTAARPIIASPALANGVAYMPGGDRRIYAFNARTGKKLWSFKARGPLEDAPAVAGGKVFFSDGVGGRLYALDAKTGKTEWTRTLDGQVSTPAVADGKVVVTANNAFAFDAETGRPLWEGFTAQASVGPAIANGVVYTLNAFGRMAAFDLATGAPLVAVLSSSPTYSTPVVSNGVVYLTSDVVRAFSAK